MSELTRRKESKRLHKGEQYGPIHLVFGRNNVNGEFWAIASDEPTTLQTFQEYGLRFDIGLWTRFKLAQDERQAKRG